MKIGDSTKNLSGEQGLSEEKTKSDKQLTDDQLDSAAGGVYGCVPTPEIKGAEGKGFARAEEKQIPCNIPASIIAHELVKKPL